MLAAEHQHVDHLPGGLRGARPPQRVEALRPAYLLALLAHRHRVLKRPRLSLQRLEIVIKPRGALLPPPQPRMPGDLLAVVHDADLAGANADSDLDRWVVGAVSG